jgi:hypothetical protein
MHENQIRSLLSKYKLEGRRCQERPTEYGDLIITAGTSKETHVVVDVFDDDKKLLIHQ